MATVDAGVFAYNGQQGSDALTFRRVSAGSGFSEPDRFLFRSQGTEALTQVPHRRGLYLVRPEAFCEALTLSLKPAATTAPIETFAEAVSLLGRLELFSVAERLERLRSLRTMEDNCVELQARSAKNLAQFLRHHPGSAQSMRLTLSPTGIVQATWRTQGRELVANFLNEPSVVFVTSVGPRLKSDRASLSDFVQFFAQYRRRAGLA